LCLGSPTDCINIYAGTRFNFQPIQLSNFRSTNVNTNNNGILNPQDGTEAPTSSAVPSLAPSSQPSMMPSLSVEPSLNPSLSAKPSETPSMLPSLSLVPSSDPSESPSTVPSVSLVPSTSEKPSSVPSLSLAPSTSEKPSFVPSLSSAPSSDPSSVPSSSPTKYKRRLDERDQLDDHERRLENLSVGGNINFFELPATPLLPFGRAALPPTFPGFGFGGTGRYNGIKCTFDLITVAQRSFFPITLETAAPTSSPTLTDEPTDFRRARDLSQEEVDSVEVERELKRKDEEDNADTGVIVQKIFFTCNQRLPLGPKAI
jgi:hypothetical protein